MTSAYKLGKSTNSPSEHANQEVHISAVILSVAALISKYQTLKKVLIDQG